MKAKRIIALLLSLMLAIGVMLALASCGGNNPPEPTGCTEHKDENGDGICDTEGCGENVTVDVSQFLNENGELILFKDGAPTFKFVIGDDVGGNEGIVRDLADKLSELGTSEVKLESYDSEVQPVEILVGRVTTRGNSYIIDKYEYGMKGYAVKQVGSKLVVIGGSDKALESAIDYLRTTVFGIKKTNKPFTDFAMAADKVYDKKQDDYTVKSVTIGDKSIKDYVVYGSGTVGKALAESFCEELYSEVGVHLEKVTAEPAASTPAIKFLSLANSGKGDGYAVYVDDNSNLVFACEFEYMFDGLAKASYTSKITGSKSSSVALPKGAVDGKNIRDIYYEDEEFGAVGDGTTNDFDAIYKTHEKANKYGHTVHANPEGTSVYYIGTTGGRSAVIMTDTYWHGNKFIFDDTCFEVHNDSNFSPSVQDKCAIANCRDCADRDASIFRVEYSEEGKIVTNLFRQFTSSNPLRGGYGETDNTTVIPGWTLDYTALVFISTTERRNFIRVGANADEGSDQLEVLLIHPGGIIDPSTPVTYDYTSISGAYAYNADERYVTPITIDGGGAMIETLANNPKTNNRYNAAARNIAIYRSNTTLMNFDHRVTEEHEYRAPYAGILWQRNCNNITYKNITLDKHYAKQELKADGTFVGQGTYEIGGSYSNDISYINVKVINFFCEGSEYDYNNKDGSHDGTNFVAGEIGYRGCMGTNWCRNFYFNGCVLNSFDAHKGLGNLYIENSTFEHINIEGSGDATIVDSNIFVDGANSIFLLRNDYGPTWNGSITVKNVGMYYNKNHDGNATLKILDTREQMGVAYLSKDYDTVLVDGEYVSDGKCTLYLPKKITVEGVNVYQYTYTKKTVTKYTGTHEDYAEVVDGVPATTLDSIDMKVIATNNLPVHLYNPTIHNCTSIDLSKQDKINNPDRITTIAPTEEIIVNNCGATIILPEGTPMHRNTVCKVDGEDVDLY